jgi:uncharacterized repeat protein (TIGR01451 family)
MNYLFLNFKRATGIMRWVGVTYSLLCVCLVASGQATLPAIDVRVIAEVEVPAHQQEREEARDRTTLAPVNRVVPGDSVIYTLEIRNRSQADVVAPVVTRPVPAHMMYVADSATGPGADVTYSVDGGVTFDRPENLRNSGADRHARRANASDYTHIRWNLRITLKPKSVAYARFRAVVK